MKHTLISCLLTAILTVSGTAVSSANAGKWNPESYEMFGIGEITAEGWIRNQMIRDMKDGNLGNLDELRKLGEPFGDKKGKGYGEFEGNYLDAIVRNAILTGYEPFLAWSKSLADRILSQQDESGFMGGQKPENFKALHSREIALWSQACYLRGLLAYAEYSDDPKYMEAIIRDVDYVMSLFADENDNFFIGESSVEGGARAHGLMFIDILESLHGITGDDKYLDFAKRLYEDYSKGKNIKNCDNQRKYLSDAGKPFLYHAPHVAEHSRVIYYLASELPGYETLKANSIGKFLQSLSPSGGMITDPFILECVGGKFGDPKLRYEYCSLTESSISLESCFRKFGDVRIAEEVENIVFNAAQAARFSDGKACAYCSRDNQINAIGEESNHTFRLQYAACHKIACCVFNQGRIMPYYVQNMWLKDRDGITAAFYGPGRLSTTFRNQRLEIEEDTMYPFENTVKFTVRPEKDVRMSLKFRIPSWADSVVISLNGGALTGNIGENMLTIDRKWKNGDVIVLSFQSGIKMHTACNNEFYFTKGALLYSMGFQEKAVEKKDFGFGNFKNYNLVPADSADIRRYEDLRLVKGIRNKFDADGGLLKFSISETADENYPYDSPYSTISVEMQSGKKKTTGILVPIGSTLLRRTTFSDTE